VSEWQDFIFGNIAEFSYGTMPKQEKLGHGKYPTFSGYKYQYKYPEFNCDKDDLIVVARGVGGTGDIKITREKCYLTNLSIKIKANKSILDNKYFYYLFSQETLRYLDSGSAQSQITINDLSKIILNLPSLQEQKAISSVLSSLDEKIALLHRQNKTIEAMAEALFKKWFVEEANADWEEVTVGDFVELNRASIDKSYPHETIEYLDTGSLTDGKIDSLQSLFLDKAPSRAKRLVQHNDVLISTVRPDQNHYGIIKNPIENLVVSTGFCVLTCTQIDPHFIYLLLTNSGMTDYLHTIAEGSTSTYPSLKPSDIGAITFQRPPDYRLKEFADIAQNSWEKIEKNYIQMRTLEKLRDTLLPKLMSGEVRVVY